MKTNQVIYGDCIEKMSELPKKSIDIILTSPPYKEEDVKGNYWEFMDKFMEQVERVTKDYALIFQSSTKLWEMCRRYRKPHHVLMWLKPLMMGLKFKYEPIFLYDFEGKSFGWWKQIGVDVYPFAPKTNGRLHPYHNPDELYIAIIKYIPKDKVILDPFMGSGTTAIACQKLGRKWLGFEINEDYKSVIKKRLEQSKLTLLTGSEVKNGNL